MRYFRGATGDYDAIASRIASCPVGSSERPDSGSPSRCGGDTTSTHHHCGEDTPTACNPKARGQQSGEAAMRHPGCATPPATTAERTAHHRNAASPRQNPCVVNNRPVMPVTPPTTVPERSGRQGFSAFDDLRTTLNDPEPRHGSFSSTNSARAVRIDKPFWQCVHPLIRPSATFSPPGRREKKRRTRRPRYTGATAEEQRQTP